MSLVSQQRCQTFKPIIITDSFFSAAIRGHENKNRVPLTQPGQGVSAKAAWNRRYLS